MTRRLEQKPCCYFQTGCMCISVYKNVWCDWRARGCWTHTTPVTSIHQQLDSESGRDVDLWAGRGLKLWALDSGGVCFTELRFSSLFVLRKTLGQSGSVPRTPSLETERGAERKKMSFNTDYYNIKMMFSVRLFPKYNHHECAFCSEYLIWCFSVWSKVG